LANELGIGFIETSAKAGVNVEEAFALLTREVKKKVDARQAMNKPETSKKINLLPSGETLRKSCCWGGNIAQETTSLTKTITSQPGSPSKKSAAFASKPE
jgi:Ras family protein